MIRVYWLLLPSVFLMLVWLHTHTDELPIVLGTVLLGAGALCLLFPEGFLVTPLVVGGALFAAETLVHFSLLSAPYPPSSGLPWVALTGYVPAIVGSVLGVGIRRLGSAATRS